MEAKKHKHIVAKIFLAIGLLDLLLFIVLSAMAGGASLTFGFIARFVLWVVIPTLFIMGVFDKGTEPQAKQPSQED